MSTTLVSPQAEPAAAAKSHPALERHPGFQRLFSRQPYAEILDELAEYVLPHFPSHP